MKVFLKFTLLAVLILSLVACANDSSGSNGSGGGDGETIVMKLSHVGAPGSPRDLGAKKFKEVVESETNGNVKVEIYPASQLGGQREQVEGVQFGDIEMVVVPTAYLGGTQPLITLLDTPFFLPEDKDKLLELYKTDAFKDILATTEDVGIKTLGLWHTAYKHFSANKPLLTPDDFNGLKFRVMASPILIEQDKALGVTPITMDFSETYSALQSGAIDGQENPIVTSFDMKFHEVQTDFTLTSHGVLDQMVMVNKNWYEELSEDIQAAIVKGYEEGLKEVVSKTYSLVDEYSQKMEEQGVTLHELTPDQRQALVDAVKSVKEFARNEYADQGGDKLFDALEKEIENLE
ncbi:TRAP transporter substrate-binding protein [Salirhabdus salicampi]|uniref:TRAP transporter substrate-binding protein n=1 Tax=Salirhabdus salicampi TaxID=476102 RepID=UPI0020C3779A|nr:TRAP transporter substrate-binding protein [Salirhabdus salicampi]MCP8615262.1 TRAP transporter substrate-binding protein [Salirhabdus salicampi]